MIGLFLLGGVVLALRRLHMALQGRIIRCPHGVRGARRYISRCTQCTLEATERDAQRKAEADRRAAEDVARRQRAFAEYRAHVRLPAYLVTMNPYEFEHLVCEVFRRQGYNVRETPKSGDDGVDGFLKKEGKLYLLQCKRVKGGIGAPIVRDLYGAMMHEGATGGFLVTTGHATESARKWASRKPIKILELVEFTDMVRVSFPEAELVPDGWQMSVHLDQYRPPV